MIKIKNKQLEKIFNRKIIKNVNVLGFDTATRTGWAKIHSDGEYTYLEYGFFKVKTKEGYARFTEFVEEFSKLITKDIDKLVLEDTFYNRNPNVFKLLTRFGMIGYMVGHSQGVLIKYFISAKQARKYLGFVNTNKEATQADFHKRLKRIKIQDNDIIDAIVLALCGLFQESKLDV